MFLQASGDEIEGLFFEYSEKSTTVRAGLNPAKAVFLTEKNESTFSIREIIIRKSSAQAYYVKEIYDSGVGVMELSLEKKMSGEAVAHGKF
ncbi:MAG: hypothetical protein EOP10_23545 [Proteobacteria bacterium]|nr:MAG: hypothetical protein EOP10_23545 [Pseudomonadota bacterium]